MSKKNLPSNKIVDCLNCGTKINTSDHFCQQCGQAIKSYELSLWQLLREMFASIFNLESKFFKTIGNIWRPAYLTEAYVRGERKKYLNPGRFFIVSFFLLSAVLSYLYKTSNDGSNKFEEGKYLYTTTIKKDMVPLFDSLSIRYPLAPVANVDSLRHGMFFSKEQLDKDSIEAPPRNFHISSDSGISRSAEQTSNLPKIALHDIEYLSQEELFEKYQVEGWEERMIYLQYLNFMKDPSSWKFFMFTNSLWTIVLSTFVVAFSMKLFYIRRPYYYVEHLILLMNLQSLMLLSAVIIILLRLCIEGSGLILWSFFSLLSTIWIIKSIRDYYKQSWFKTLVKYFLISAIQIAILIVSLLIVAGISALLYQ